MSDSASRRRLWWLMRWGAFSENAKSAGTSSDHCHSTDSAGIR